jgi:hypothetical protein
VAFGLAAGCGGSETGAVPQDTEGPESAETAAQPPQTDASSGAPRDTDEPPEPQCPPPDPSATVDGLEHRARAQGGSFIEILDLEARGPYVYGCTGTQGLTIWNVDDDDGDLESQRVGPLGLAHADFPRCQHIALDASGERAVITNRGDEVQPQPWLYVYDVRDPSAPQALRGQATVASIEGAAWRGDRIYAAAHTAGIVVFEDAGGDTLQSVGSFSDETSDAWLPLVHDNLLYVAEGATGLRIYDIAGDDPVLLSTLPLEGSSRDLARDGDTLFVAASSSVVAVDVSDPLAPVVLAETATAGTAVAIAHGSDGLVYTAEWDEVRVYDPAAALTRVWSEVVPTGDDFSRVLTLAHHPDRTRVYAGEWTGMHIFESHPDPTAPDILATPPSVQFGRLSPGDAEDRVVVLRNEGDQPLNVFGASAQHDAVTVDDACFSVEPGGAHAMELRFAPDSDLAVVGSVTLRTDDPDEQAFEVRYGGNAAGADVGDPMPDFMLRDLDGNDWTLADLDGKVVLLAYFATF